MPELPEVQAAKVLVGSRCLGGVIVKALVANDSKVIDGVTPAALQKALLGKKILETHRKGKHLWLQLDSPPYPSFQFGMSGAVVVKGVKGLQYKSSKVDDTEEFPSKYWKVHLKLDTGVEVAFTDKRRFARVRLLDDPAKEPPISELGLDAYLELPSAKDFTEALKTKKGAIKALLLDQSFLAGIGNWVGDEVLYQVLDKAVSVHADSEKFPRSWIFHHRWDRKPGKIRGNQIETVTVGGRTSAYVPNIQKYSGRELKGARRKAAIAHDIPHDETDTDENVDPAVGEVAADKEMKTQPKHSRGRPPKHKVDNVVNSTPSAVSSAGAKKRGRPSKQKPTSSEGKVDTEEIGTESLSEPKRRGRPPKVKTDTQTKVLTKEGEKTSEDDDSGVEDAGEAPNKLAGAGTPKRRDRPPKSKPEAAEEVEIIKKIKLGLSDEGSASPKRGRGRPPKTKSDPEAKLADTKNGHVEVLTQVAENAVPTLTPKKRGRPSKTKAPS
uniref:Formamidopyrimidine-DNA glycosylase catalytic domain-containing protein n=1 Tax=Physcomitrium patens TaxID=3218 RepID=A0A7I4CKH0_PHYPA